MKSLVLEVDIIVVVTPFTDFRRKHLFAQKVALFYGLVILTRKTFQA